MCNLTTRWSGPGTIVGRTLDANRLLAGSACGKRQRARPLNSVVRHHVMTGSTKRTLSFVALLAGLGQVHAVCIEAKPAPEAEFDSATTVVIAHAITEQEIPESSKFEFGGIRYVVAVDEVLKGTPRSRITLTYQRDSGRFPMDHGKSYLLFVTPSRDGLGASNCGNSGETARLAEVLDRIRARKSRKGT
jgi:hypothetical protein